VDGDGGREKCPTPCKKGEKIFPEALSGGICPDHNNKCNHSTKMQLNTRLLSGTNPLVNKQNIQQDFQRH